MIEFKHHRMLVGWRFSDWSKIWYSPIVEEKSETRTQIGLYESPEQPGESSLVRHSEVLWLPHFEPKVFAATPNANSREKRQLHTEFLHEAWKWLESNGELEEDEEWYLDSRGGAQWTSWVAMANKSERVRRKIRKTAKHSAGGRGIGDNKRKRKDESRLHTAMHVVV